jgi:hypothetical protein
MNCTRNQQEPQEEHELVEMLANTKALTELDLSHCRIGSSLGI